MLVVVPPEHHAPLEELSFPAFLICSCLRSPLCVCVLAHARALPSSAEQAAHAAAIFTPSPHAGRVVIGIVLLTTF